MLHYGLILSFKNIVYIYKCKHTKGMQKINTGLSWFYSGSSLLMNIKVYFFYHFFFYKMMRLSYTPFTLFFLFQKMVLPGQRACHRNFGFSSVIQLCPTLCDPMDCSTPGLPVHHQLPELTQTHVQWVGDAIQPSHPLSSPSPPSNFGYLLTICTSKCLSVQISNKNARGFPFWLSATMGFFKYRETKILLEKSSRQDVID